MRTEKRILNARRLRRVPNTFSWVDHRLVREGRLRGLSHEAQALYLFLVTVSDAEGLSYYSDAKAAEALDMGVSALAPARRELLGADLIAYRYPLYQVLSLDRTPTPIPDERAGHGRTDAQAAPIGEVLAQMLRAPGAEIGGAR